MKPPVVGLIGMGKMGTIEARKCTYLHELGLVNFAAISDIDPTKEDTARNVFGRRFYRNASEMYKKERLDGVIIATQAEDHPRNVIAAVDADIKYILSEKPFALPQELNTGLQALHYAEKHGVKTMTGYIPCYERVVEIFMKNRDLIGKILKMKCDREGQRAFRFRKLDAFSDLGVYTIILGGYFYGWPNIEHVRSTYASFLDGINIDESMFTVRTESGGEIIGHAEWYVDTPNSRPKIRRTYVLGEKGYAIIKHDEPNSPESLFIADADTHSKMFAPVAERSSLDEGITGNFIPIEKYDKKTDDAICRELKHFFGVISNDGEFLTSTRRELELLKGVREVLNTE